MELRLPEPRAPRKRSDRKFSFWIQLVQKVTCPGKRLGFPSLLWCVKDLIFWMLARAFKYGAMMLSPLGPLIQDARTMDGESPYNRVYVSAVYLLRSFSTTSALSLVAGNPLSCSPSLGSYFVALAMCTNNTTWTRTYCSALMRPANVACNHLSRGERTSRITCAASIPTKSLQLPSSPCWVTHRILRANERERIQK